MARTKRGDAGNGIGRYLREHALGLALLVLFLGSLAGQVLAGRIEANRERADRGQPPLALAEYVASPHFVSATFENWESEFLQMGVFVLLSVWLREKGSAESRPLDPADEKHPRFPKARQPWAARQQGWVRRLYECSLTLAFALLFAVSFVAHLLGSHAQHAEDQHARGEPASGLLDYLGNARFWFESFQNWQSEFVSVLAIVMLTVWLRQKDSPQSKPVEAPHDHTGH